MTTITREQAQKIIEAADEVISALAGTNEDVHPGSDNMLRLWDDLNDRYAPPEVVRELARIVLASLEAEPVAYIFKHPAGKLFWALTDESNKEQADVIPVYAAAPASVVPDDASGSLAYAYKELTPEIMRGHIAVFERYGIAPNDSITTIQALRIALDGIERSDAMLHGAEPASNHEELPLDYLQGQKDGLEWAAQLAEANHPQTGDWLYDDPLELAKAIRKGPDMPEFDGPTPVTPDGWISCSERMPAQDDWILIYSKHGEYMAGQVQGEYVELSDGTLSWLGNALYWMPLPEPPQEVK